MDSSRDPKGIRGRHRPNPNRPGGQPAARAETRRRRRRVQQEGPGVKEVGHRGNERKEHRGGLESSSAGARNNANSGPRSAGFPDTRAVTPSPGGWRNERNWRVLAVLATGLVGSQGSSWAFTGRPTWERVSSGLLLARGLDQSPTWDYTRTVGGTAWFTRSGRANGALLAVGGYRHPGWTDPEVPFRVHWCSRLAG